MSTWQVIHADCRDALRALPECSVHCVVTSPPYFGLRDYGTGEWEGGDPACDHSPEARGGRFASPVSAKQASNTGSGTASSRDCPCGARRVDQQVGLEPTPDEYVAALVGVFREVRRVLRDDGTVWLNLGDSYAANRSYQVSDSKHLAHDFGASNAAVCPPGCKPKDLIGIPWLVAFALRADGWYLRSEIILAKRNPMPESVRDRPTRAHEQFFLLTKRPTYFYDSDAIREPNELHGASDEGYRRDATTRPVNGATGTTGSYRMGSVEAGRNKRSVWWVSSEPYSGSHFATFGTKWIEPCILAGAPVRACGECGAPWVRMVSDRGPSPEFAPLAITEAEALPREGRGTHRNMGGRYQAWLDANPRQTVGFEPSCSHGDGSATGVVLDPFAGAGTTGLVALQHGRGFIGIELSAEYARMARERIDGWVRCGFRAPARGPDADPAQAAFDLFGEVA